ncbi:hypothetical protein DYB32_004943 [Aphanomyces invadans]|uniref:FF domain-containing protein n=1 Tax=Aphanomyces invadans TaxID=157072 RepID=A0A418AVV5_9STRA|nr:hypothetical protein DYB32_004943 [Aphanomyces invadans]
MLMEYYFRSDHLTTTWEDARAEIQHRSAYRALDDGAEVAFQQYMQKLQKKMESLTKTRKAVEASGTFRRLTRHATEEEQEEFEEKLQEKAQAQSQPERVIHPATTG